MIHIGEKPFSCHNCDQYSSQTGVATLTDLHMRFLLPNIIPVNHITHMLEYPVGGLTIPANCSINYSCFKRINLDHRSQRSQWTAEGSMVPGGGVKYLFYDWWWTLPVKTFKLFYIINIQIKNKISGWRYQLHSTSVGDTNKIQPVVDYTN